MKSYNALFVFLAGLTVFLISGCGTSSEDATLFSNVDRITISSPDSDGSRNGTINYTLPNGNCKYVVVALFDTFPVITSGNILSDSTPIVYGTRTNFTGYVESAQPWTELYSYGVSTGDFSSETKIDLGSVTGNKYLAIWAFDSGMSLIASSPVVSTVQ